MTDREKLIALVKRAITDWEHGDVSEKIADHLIANGVVVREKGEWIWSKRHSNYFCSRCGAYDISIPNFCPECGADMRIEEQNRAREGENDGV